MLFKIFTFISIFSYAYGVLYPIAVRLPLLGDPPLPGAALWPKPLKVEQSVKYYFINKNAFKIHVDTTKANNCEREILNNRIDYYLNILFPPKLAYEAPSESEEQQNTLKIEIKNSKPDSVNCKKDYYPIINNSDEEYCKKCLKGLEIFSC